MKNFFRKGRKGRKKTMIILLKTQKDYLLMITIKKILLTPILKILSS